MTRRRVGPPCIGQLHTYMWTSMSGTDPSLPNGTSCVCGAIVYQASTTKELRNMSHPTKLTEDEVLEEVCRRRGDVSPAIQAVYEKYRHLDQLLSDAVWTRDNIGDDVRLSILYDLWQAIKSHVGTDSQP